MRLYGTTTVTQVLQSDHWPSFDSPPLGAPLLTSTAFSVMMTIWKLKSPGKDIPPPPQDTQIRSQACNLVHITNLVNEVGFSLTFRLVTTMDRAQLISPHFQAADS